MEIMTSVGWVDAFDWRAVVAAGKSPEITIKVNAEAHAQTDRVGEWPTYNIRRCFHIGITTMREMLAEYKWSPARYKELLVLWSKTYKEEYKNREELEAFLRSVGQR